MVVPPPIPTRVPTDLRAKAWIRSQAGSERVALVPAPACSPPESRRALLPIGRSPFIFQLPATSGRSRSTLMDASCHACEEKPLPEGCDVFQPAPPFPAELRWGIATGSSRVTIGFTMLRGMRKASQGVVGKVVATVLFGILIISFAIWGIGDIFRATPQNVVARVGQTDITTDQFRVAFHNEFQRINRQFGGRLTQQQARAFGLDQQVLARLVNDAILNERAKDLGLSVSDQLVVRTIADQPAFRGPTASSTGLSSRPRSATMGSPRPASCASSAIARAAPSRGSHRRRDLHAARHSGGAASVPERAPGGFLSDPAACCGGRGSGADAGAAPGVLPRAESLVPDPRIPRLKRARRSIQPPWRSRTPSPMPTRASVTSRTRRASARPSGAPCSRSRSRARPKPKPRSAASRKVPLSRR